MDIKSNLQKVLSDLPESVHLVAVSKFHPKEALMEAYNAGQRIFGESKVQEMTEKQEALPKDIQWHFIGHLQTNKIKYMAPYVAMIHGVDSYKLLIKINKQAEKCRKEDHRRVCISFVDRGSIQPDRFNCTRVEQPPHLSDDGLAADDDP